MPQKVKLKKSNVPNKIPSADTMDFGEVYVNYASGNGKSFLATKKYDGTVAQFMEKGYGDSLYSTKAEASDYAAAALANAKDYTDVLSGNVHSTFLNYATSANVYNTLSRYATSTNTHTAINAINTKLENYSTKAEASEYAAAALANAMIYTDDASGDIESNFSKYATSADVHSTINTVYFDERYAYKTGSADTAGEWTVQIPDITELYDGLTIKIRLETSYNSTRNYLNLNGLGYKIVCFRRGTSLTGHYAQYSELRLTYRTDGCGAGIKSHKNLDGLVSGTTYYDGWVIENVYDSTDTYSLRELYARYYVGPDRFSPYQFVGVNRDYQLVPLTVKSAGTNSTATTRPVTQQLIRPSKFYYSTYSDYKATNTILPGDYLYAGYATTNIRYTFNVSFSANSTVYMRGTYYSDVDLFAIYSGDSEDFMVCVPSSSTTNIDLSSYFVEGWDYIYMGQTYSSVNYFYLTCTHPMYRFDGENLVEYDNYRINELESVVEEDERVTAAALNDLNDKVNLCKSVIEEDERVTAAALNDLNVRVSGCATVESVIENELVTAEALNYLYDDIDGMWSELGRYATSSDVHSTISRYATSASVHTAIKGIDTKLGKYATSSNVYTTLGRYVTSATVYTNLTKYATSANTHAAIDAVNQKLTNVYKYKGSKTNYTDLPTNGNTAGDVWNVINANGNIGDANYTPPGTNYAWDGTAWDPLGGSIDLSNYVENETLDYYTTKAEASEYAAAALANAKNYTDNRLLLYATSANVHTRINAVDAKFGNYATSTSTHTAINAVNTKFGNYATSTATHTAINAVNTKFGSYATSTSTHTAINAVNTKFGSYATSASTHSAINAVNVRLDSYATSANVYSSIDAINTKLIGYATKANASEYAAAALANARNYSDELSGNVNTKFGSYATSTATHTAINAVNTKFGSYATSTATHTAINAVNTKFGSYATSTSTHTAINAVNTKFGSYATSTSTHTAINAVNTKFGSYATSTSTHTAINAVNAKFANYSTSANTHNAITVASGNIATHLASNYATSADTSYAISSIYSSITDNELVIAAALCDLNERLLDINDDVSNLNNGELNGFDITTATSKHFIVGVDSNNKILNSENTHYQDEVYMENGSIYQTSDETLKDFGENIKCNLDDLYAIPKKYFVWKKDDNKRKQIGTSAQKLMEYYPEIVSLDEKGKLGVSYDKLSIVALAAIDKLYDEIKDLKLQISEINKIISKNG